MSDTVEINSIDQNEIANGYVIVDTTVTVNGSTYNSSDTNFVIQAIEAVGVINGVQTQAEQFRQQVLNAPIAVSDTTTLNSLVGEVINL